MAEKTPTRLALFWQKNGWFGLILIAAALLLFGIAAILTAAAEREESAAIATEGTVAALVVIEPAQRLSSADAYDQTSYSVHVDFTVDGQEYRASQSIEEEDFEQFTKGQTIPVRYLPDDPNRIWVESSIDDPSGCLVSFNRSMKTAMFSIMKVSTISSCLSFSGS